MCKENYGSHQGSGREVALLPRRSSTYFEKPKAWEIAKFKGSHLYSITFLMDFINHINWGNLEPLCSFELPPCK